MTLLLTILAFGIMIFVHELGHYWTARRCGVGIDKFSIGFGKPIKEWTRKGVKWRISWIPLGGYVKMKGENPGETEAEASLSFQKKPWWKKVLIGLSGPVANLLLGLLLFIVSFLLPLRVEDQRPVVSRADGKWEQIFLPGDSLAAVNGKPVKGFSDFLEEFLIAKGGTVSVYRSGEILSLDVAPAEAESLALNLYPAVESRVGEVIPKTPAYHAKLIKGDLITAVDSVAVTDWYAMRELIVNSPKNSVLLTIERNGKTFRKALNLESSLATGAAKTIGVIQYQPVKYVRHFNPLEALKLGAFNTVNFISLNYQMLGKLVQKPDQLRKSVGGPVMIASMSQQMGQKGLANLLIFFASISLMLAIMNLLPIPILDGGLVLFAILEGIFRRPVPAKVQSILQSIGLTILLGLMFLAFYSDVYSEILRFMNR